MEDLPVIFPQEIYYDGTILGIGKYGVVKKGICRGQEVAVKIVRSIGGGNRFMEEIRVMSRIRAPNVCLLLGACIENNGDVSIVQEYLPGGDLGNLLKNNKLPPTILRRMLWARDVARGMMWIHKNNIFHRDLKLENLLLDKHGEIKVCDFGLSDLCYGESIVGQSVKGTPLYLAPEVFLKYEITSKVDVYSFGLVLWELLTKQRVFPHHHNKDHFMKCICDNHERPPIPPNQVSNNVKEDSNLEEPKYDAWKDYDLMQFLNNCWQHDPNLRPNFLDIFDKLTSKILCGYIDDSLAREFWQINFQNEFEVSWDLFVSVLSKKIIFNNNDDTFKKEVIECLKRALGQFEDNHTCIRGDVKVTQEIFGKLLSWFGPFVDERGTFLHRLLEICSNPWFHGKISLEVASNLLNTKKNLSNQEANNLDNLFLVRYSSKPGYYTVQTLLNRFSIIKTNGQFHLEGHNDPFPSLKELVENRIKIKYPDVCQCTYFFNQYTSITNTSNSYAFFQTENTFKLKLSE